MNRNSETEQKIIATAIEVFIEKGQAGARMQDIADRAGINKALLHYYFRNKNQLFKKAFETVLMHFLQSLFESAKTISDIRQFLKLFIDRYIDTVSQHPQMLRFILWEIENGGEIFASAARKVFAEKGFDTIPLIPIIQDAVARGVIKPVDPLQFTLSLLGMCVYPFIASPLIQKVVPGFNPFAPSFLEARKKAIFELMWVGLKPENETHDFQLKQ
jgi:TetR/AcrR family transcriptional regulator